tara:strand:+ start:1288 stop:1650 length:363 start_codon:yes stop_codon:yes gene_type:complete
VGVVASELLQCTDRLEPIAAHRRERVHLRDALVASELGGERVVGGAAEEGEAESVLGVPEDLITHHLRERLHSLGQVRTHWRRHVHGQVDAFFRHGTRKRRKTDVKKKTGGIVRSANPHF